MSKPDARSASREQFRSAGLPSHTKEHTLTTQSNVSTTHVQDLARLMATDGMCPHRVWHTSRHPGPMRTSTATDADPAHASRVRKLAGDLEDEVAEVYPALRNAFEVSGSRSGARLKGRPDIIIRDSDGLVTVYDVQEHEPDPADELVVKLCMFLLPRSNNGRWRGSQPSGCVLYPDGSGKHIEADEIDAGFIESVAVAMRQLASDEPAPRVPSAAECGRCPLTAEECSDRVEMG